MKVRPSLKHSYNFNGQATYLISGGLGGLGREIVRWMFSRGARHFLLLTSSGATGKPDRLKFLKEVRELGAVVLAPACDVTNRQDLVNTLQKALEEMPPVKGCIQAAMHLQVSISPFIFCFKFIF